MPATVDVDRDKEILYLFFLICRSGFWLSEANERQRYNACHQRTRSECLCPLWKHPLPHHYLLILRWPPLSPILPQQGGDKRATTGCPAVLNFVYDYPKAKKNGIQVQGGRKCGCAIGAKNALTGMHGLHAI